MRVEIGDQAVPARDVVGLIVATMAALPRVRPVKRRQTMNNEGTAKTLPTSWREVMNEMEHEWDRLHLEIAQLRTERDQLSKALVAVFREEVTLSGEEVLAQIGREKPLREFLQEMRAQLVGD